jgi:hypothetical protein
MAVDSTTYTTLAFECDEENKAISTSERPKMDGDWIRICVQPSQFTLERGVVLRRIDQFLFEKVAVNSNEETREGESDSNDVIIQQAILSGGIESEDTLITCRPGSELCVFTTKLRQTFFVADGEVVGKGVAVLEVKQQEGSFFGDDRRYLLRRLRSAQFEDDIAGIFHLEVQLTVRESYKNSSLESSSSGWDGEHQSVLSFHLLSFHF